MAFLQLKQRNGAVSEGVGVSMAEFQQSALFWIILLGVLPLLVWQMYANQSVLLLITILFGGAALWLSFRKPVVSGAVWFLGFAAQVFWIAQAYEAPLVSLALCLAPLVAVLVFGFRAGGLAAGVTLFGMWGVMDWQPGLGLQAYWEPVMLATLAMLGIGGVVRYLFMDLLENFYRNYAYTAARLEEARQQRVELKQVQDDLLHANREEARLTRQLKVLNQVAEEARRAKETFVATVSHELRTPLNMIIGFSEVITQSPRVYGIRLPATLLADIASIQRNSQHLLELVNDVLDLSQVDMGNLSIAREWCVVQDLVNESFEVIRPLFVSKGLFLKAEVPDTGLRVFCDHTRVREVIINLLSNAGRFTETGGVCVQVTSAEQSVVIGVQDTGPGISPENQEKLFEPFQQLDSSIRRVHGGSGLGLAISKRFVEMHGGKMWLESRVGVGTTFFFSLPLQIPDDPASIPAAARWVNEFAIQDQRSRPFKASLAAPTPRCVILEEGNTMQRLINRYLGEVEVQVVAGLEEAVDAVSQSPTQLMVINHPEAEDLLRSVNSQDRLPFGLPVLAFWMPGGKDFSDSLGVDRYLVKPVSKEMLLGALQSLGDSIHRVLLVDDNPEILQLFGRILSSAEKEYQVLRASGGQQGMEMLRSRKPDAMIIDLVMPEINGFQVLQEKARDPELAPIPVIVITAQDPAGLPKVSEAVTVAREGGFSPRDLLGLVQSVGLNFDRLRNLF